MKKNLLMVLAVVLGALIGSASVYLVLNKEIRDWQLVVDTLEERLLTLEQR